MTMSFDTSWGEKIFLKHRIGSTDGFQMWVSANAEKARLAMKTHTHTHTHKLKGAVTGLARSLSVCLSLSPSLSSPLSISPCLTLSPRLSVSLRVSLSLCLHVCLNSPPLSISLSPSLCLTLHPSVSSCLSLSLSLCLSLSFRPPPRGSSGVNESLGRPHGACDLSRAGAVETRRLHPSDGEPAGSEGCLQSGEK